MNGISASDRWEFIVCYNSSPSKQKLNYNQNARKWIFISFCICVIFYVLRKFVNLESKKQQEEDQQQKNILFKNAMKHL